VKERQEADARREALAQLVPLDDSTAMVGAREEGDPITVTDASGQPTTWRKVQYTRLRATSPWAPLVATEDVRWLPVDVPVDEAHKYLTVATAEAVKAEQSIQEGAAVAA
jgi:hypothetical protein